MEVNTGSSRMRPMSARRRPSMPNLLDAIPEVSTTTNRAKPEDDYVLPYDDIAEIFTSCQDNRFPIKNVFKTPPTSMSNSSSRDHITISPTSSNHHLPHSLSMGSLSGTGNHYSSPSNTLLPITENAVVTSPSSSSTNLHSSNNHTNPNNPNTPSAGSTTISPHRGLHMPHRTFHRKGTGHLGGGVWMSTGLVPHFIVITFYEKWLIKKVKSISYYPPIF